MLLSASDSSSFSGEQLLEKEPIFSVCLAVTGDVTLKLLFRILFSHRLFERERLGEPFVLTSRGITRDFVFLTSNGIMRTPGFCEVGLVMTVVVGVVGGLATVSWSSSALLLVLFTTVGVFVERQDVGAVGAVVTGLGTGGSGGLEFICCFSGDGVFDLEFTTSSFI